jgi:hypothetical protein
VIGVGICGKVRLLVDKRGISVLWEWVYLGMDKKKMYLVKLIKQTADKYNF